MAKGYLEKMLMNARRFDVEVFSRGTAPLEGMEATAEAKEIIRQAGWEISGHRSRKLNELDIRESDLIFVMENRHKEYILAIDPDANGKTYLLRDFAKIGDFNVTEDCNIPDPIGRDINFYKRVFSVIKDSVERILREI